MSFQSIQLGLGIIFTAVRISALLIFSVLPTCIYRQVICCISKISKPNFVRILPSISSFAATDDIYGKPTSGIVAQLIFDGVIDFNKIVNRFEDLINDPGYVELKCKLTQWMGFYFWEEDRTFQLSDNLYHIKKSVDRLFVDNFMKELVTKPFIKGKPLWDVYSFSNVNIDGKVQSANFLRAHHCLVDGYSLMAIMERVHENEKDSAGFRASMPQPNFKGLHQSKKKIILSVLKNILSVPFEVLKTVSCSTKWNEFKRDPSEFDVKYNFSQVNGIPLDDLKAAAKFYKAPTSALLYAAVTAALRKTIIKLGMKMPNVFYSTCMIPLPNRPPGLTNHFGYLPIPSPVWIESSIERLNYINNYFEYLKTSGLPLATSWLVNMMGRQVIPFLKVSLKDAPTAAVFTNFPGPQTHTHMLGLELVELSFLAGISNATAPCMFTTMTYGGKLSLTVQTDTSFFGDSNIEEHLLEEMKNELRLFTTLQLHNA